MWVKIKSDKIPNVVLTVPYSAFLNSYKKKSFYILEDKNTKNITNNKNEVKETTIELNEEEKQALNELKQNLDENVEQDFENKVVENEEKQDLSFENEDNNAKIKKIVTNNRTPIKKAPNTKR